jgi:heme-degrading monooxygenase HmoA
LDFHLAQINIALPLEPVDSELLSEFVAALDPVNALADESAGFVWRLQTEDGNATAVRAFDDDRLIVNMSVWESLEALRAFVYTSGHTDVMRRRREWFHKLDIHMALWWVPEGHIPAVAEAEDRLRTLDRLGPTSQAFTFRRHFPSPSAAGVDDDRWLCPA